MQKTRTLQAEIYRKILLRDGDNIIPVQFEVEQYVDENNRLYLAVALTKTEISQGTPQVQYKGSINETSSDINVPQKVPGVNNKFMQKGEKNSENGQFSSGSPLHRARENLNKYELGEKSW